jgi:hypothetical protein
VTVPRVHLGPHGQRRVATLLATAAVGRGSDGRASHGPVSAGGAAGVLLVEAPTPQLQLLPVHFLLLVAATTRSIIFLLATGQQLTSTVGTPACRKICTPRFR